MRRHSRFCQHQNKIRRPLTVTLKVQYQPGILPKLMDVGVPAGQHASRVCSQRAASVGRFRNFSVTMLFQKSVWCSVPASWNTHAVTTRLDSVFLPLLLNWDLTDLNICCSSQLVMALVVWYSLELELKLALVWCLLRSDCCVVASQAAWH